MRKNKIPYTVEELAWIKDHCTLTREKAHNLFCAKFTRTDVTLNNYTGLCKRNGWLTGRDGRMQTGGVSWNRGKKMPYNAASAATRFKKGHSPLNTKFAGHERIRKEDGYVEISINETNPHTGFERRYILKHKYLWEKKNGPIPKGMCLKCIDGNRQNSDPANWELIKRGVLPYLSGRWDGLVFDKAKPEIKPSIMALAKLRHARKARTK